MKILPVSNEYSKPKANFGMALKTVDWEGMFRHWHPKPHNSGEADIMAILYSVIRKANRQDFDKHTPNSILAINPAWSRAMHPDEAVYLKLKFQSTSNPDAVYYTSLSLSHKDFNISLLDRMKMLVFGTAKGWENAHNRVKKLILEAAQKGDRLVNEQSL